MPVPPMVVMAMNLASKSSLKVSPVQSSMESSIRYRREWPSGPVPTEAASHRPTVPEKENVCWLEQ